MPDERDDIRRQRSREKEVVHLEVKEKLAYAIKSWNERDDEEVDLWREHRVWGR